MFRRDPDVKSCAGMHMDESRVDVPIEAIREHFATFWQNVSGAPSHFLINVDEMGH
jgi:hypothetical protein